MNYLKGKIITLVLIFKEFYKRVLLFRKRKKIGYIGGHGAKNLGDDVMIVALNRSLPNYDIVSLQSYGVEKVLSFISLSGKNYFSTLILGGGTLINDIWFTKVEKSLDFDIPMISLGTGVGACGVEQNNEGNYHKWKDVLPKFKYIGVRGNNSQDRLKKINVSSEVIGDLALLLATDNITKNYHKEIGLNLMDIPEYNFYWMKMIPLLSEYIKLGWKIKPIVLNINDLDYTSTYCKQLNINDEIKVIDSFEEFNKETEKLSFIIGVRLHASILSLCCAVPTILLGYRDKSYDFMDTIGLLPYYISLEDERVDNNFTISEKIAPLLDEHLNIKLRREIVEKTNEYKGRLEQSLTQIV